MAGAGVGLWSVLDDPAIGLALFLLADTAGAVPTLRDTRLDPHKEAAEPWLLGLVASAVNLPPVEGHTRSVCADGLGSWAFPVYLTLLNAGMVALIGRGRTLLIKPMTSGVR